MSTSKLKRTDMHFEGKNIDDKLITLLLRRGEKWKTSFRVVCDYKVLSKSTRTLGP